MISLYVCDICKVIDSFIWQELVNVIVLLLITLFSAFCLAQSLMFFCSFSSCVQNGLYLRGFPLGMFSFALCCIILQKFFNILCALSSVLMVLSLVSTWSWNLVQFALLKFHVILVFGLFVGTFSEMDTSTAR